MIKYIYLISIVVFIISCQKKEEIKCSVGNETIKVNETNRVLTKNDLVDSLTFVSLYTDQENLIGKLGEVFLLEDFIIVEDRHSQVVYVYNRDGSLYNKINSKGSGPGEYSTIMDIDVEAKKRLIYIMDYTSRKLMQYSFEGKFIKEEKMDEYFAFASKIPNEDKYLGEQFDFSKGILFTFGEGTKTHFFDNIQFDKKKYELFSLSRFGSKFYTFHDSVYYISISIFDYSIYKYSDEKLSCEYNIDFAKEIMLTSRTSVKEIDKNNPQHEVDDIMDGGFVFSFINLIISDKYISFCVLGGIATLPSQYVLYNKATKECVFYKDLLGMKSQYPFVAEHNGTFVFPIYPGENIDFLQDQVNVNIKEDDNPVLCLMKLKDF